MLYISIPFIWWFRKLCLQRSEVFPRSDLARWLCPQLCVPWWFHWTVPVYRKVISTRYLFISFNGSVVEYLYGSMVQYLNGSMVEYLYGSMVQYLNGSMVEYLYGSMVQYLNGLMVQYLYGSIFVWFSGSLVPYWYGSVVWYLVHVKIVSSKWSATSYMVKILTSNKSNTSYIIPQTDTNIHSYSYKYFLIQ